MRIFRPSSSAASSRPRPLGSGRWNLPTVSAVGALGLSALALVLPVDFVTESPGPTFNTTGDYKDRKLISIEGANTFPTDGRLDMTTVQVAGGPNSTIGALQVLSSWFDPSHAVLPSDLVYSPALSSQEVSERNSADMTNSQEIAQAAALTYLGVGYGETLTVTGTAEGSPSAGVFEHGDIIRAINDQPLTSYQSLTQALDASAGQPVLVSFERAGQAQQLELSPVFNEQTGRYVLGLYISRTFDFPLKVTYGLDQVGGPSAGLMFSLGIVDVLTDGSMTGGKHFAGTGSIETDGTVGSIGGIEQKMKGAREAGAQVFLAPAANCPDVVGAVPEGLAVVSVSSLAEAADAVTRIGAGEDPAVFPTCS